MISQIIKLKIVDAMTSELDRIGSSAKLARKLGINPAQVSRVLKGEMEGVLSDANWYSVAAILSVDPNNRAPIIAAQTPTFKFVNTQLAICQDQGLSLLLCDEAGIGKTFAAKHYVNTHSNAVYVDCSQVKSKQRLVRYIAKQFGLDNNGRYAEVYEALVFYLKATPGSLIVLDEAGDLDYPAFLELKALWNATEHLSGWYMMGADGLRAKIEMNIGQRKVGYSEIFRRYGEKFQRVSPLGGEDAKAFHKQQVALVAKVNGISDIQALYARTGGSLSRVYLEIQKLQLSNNTTYATQSAISN